MSPTPHSDRRRRTRRNTAIGVTAGLLGGGAIGLLMTVPSLTSAATDDSAAVEPAALQDDGDTPAEGERPEPGAELRELLQVFVDDGTLTEAEADEIAQYIVDNRPEREGGRHHHHPHHHPHRHPRGSQVVADAIGIDVETLRNELRDGASVADVAEANGVDVDDLIDELVAQADERLDDAVENGRLTQDEADAKLEQIGERITDGIDDTRPFGR